MYLSREEGRGEPAGSRGWICLLSIEAQLFSLEIEHDMARKEQRWKAATYEAREGDELMHPKNKSIPFQLEEHFHNISVDQHRYMSAHAQFGFLIASGWISLIGVMGCKLLQWFSIIQYLLHPPCNILHTIPNVH